MIDINNQQDYLDYLTDKDKRDIRAILERYSNITDLEQALCSWIEYKLLQIRKWLDRGI